MNRNNVLEMSEKQIMTELYSCRICQENLLRGQLCSEFPEAIIGNWHADFIMIGVNPGKNEATFNSVKEYIKWYSSNNFTLNWGRCAWGYFEAYKRLATPDMSDNEIVLEHFNKHAAILNLIKCSTPNTKGISEKNLERAKDNCIGYLMRQLNYMQPKVVLSHGKFATKTMLNLLTNDKFGFKTKGISKLETRLLTAMNYMDEISKETIVAYEGTRKMLFLFNKHLSYFGPAMKSLQNNIQAKKDMVAEVLRET